MTIDERLDRLTERHEALTESVEMLTHDIQELRASVADLKAIAEASLQNINALAGIAENHERRITRLEGHE